MALRDTLDRVSSFEVMDAPVGGGVALAIADALSGALIELVQGFINIPPVVTGIGISVIDRRYLNLEKYLGDRLDTLVNLALCKKAIDDQFNLTEKVKELVSKVIPSKSTEGIGSSPSISLEGIESASSSIGEIPSFEIPSSTGVGLKAADILELRKKRIQAYSE